MRSTSGPERPPIWVRVADAAALVFLLLTVIVSASDGFVVRTAGLRLSFRSEWRLAVWAIGLLVVRHLAYRRFPLHRRVRDGFITAAQSPGRSAARRGERRVVDAARPARSRSDSR